MSFIRQALSRRTSMPTLLHIDSSPHPEGASISRHLTNEFVQSWKQAHPDGRVITRDLTATSGLAVIDGTWVGAAYTPEDKRTSEQRALLSLSETFIHELFEADEYIIAAPMHNFSIPSVLRLWIDQICRAGKTFSYVDGVASGKLTGKKATFVISTGGNYAEGSTLAGMNFVEPYLRAVFGFLGVTDTHFHTASSVAMIAFGTIDRPSFLKPHIDAIRARFQTA
jgi:FMN-dependent NADH-azoreductase